MSTHAANYASRILRVQLFIQEHLDEELSLDRLAEIAGYSPYHFHRIFRGQVGERLDDYVRRLRMERAAHSLRYREQSVLNVALDAGYGSHEGFTRAFQRIFGVTPSEYQALEHPPAPRKAYLMQTVNFSLTDVQIVARPAMRLAGFRVVGPYSAEFLGPAFSRLGEWVTREQLWGPATESIGVYHDDPEITPPEKQRADVCITVGPDFVPKADVQVQTLPAGQYAVLVHRGPYENLGESYRWLYGVWLPQSGREPADSPPYERYLNDCNTVQPADLLTEICIPLR